MYGERFDIPMPKDVVFITWFKKAAKSSAAASHSSAATAESSISLPGHETFPIFYDKNIRKVLVNAAKWAAPRIVREIPCPCVEPLEEIRTKLED